MAATSTARLCGPLKRWQQIARTELEQISPEVLMLAEASDPGLLLTAFDVVKPLTWPWADKTTLNGFPLFELGGFDWRIYRRKANR